MKILVVEDDRDIRELICQSLELAEYQVQSCLDVKSAQKLVTEFSPDCLIVDWMLPDSSGIELIRWIRRQTSFSHLPVLMLTARGQEADKILGLDSGADDYMTKPMSLRELHARVKALLRRPASYQPVSEVVQVGAMVLNTATHELRIDEAPVEVSRTEYKLLKFFVEHPEKVHSRDHLLSAIWGENTYPGDRTVDVHILRLRKILKKYGLDSMIKTVRGAGYRFSGK
ncbi:MAG: response regulator transcription factor [Gammaproteobacteria bacterium]|nr:response regulator transcription factor [Gammaproteobacteria bacterium]